MPLYIESCPTGFKNAMGYPAINYVSAAVSFFLFILYFLLALLLFIYINSFRPFPSFPVHAYNSTSPLPAPPFHNLPIHIPCHPSRYSHTIILLSSTSYTSAPSPSTNFLPTYLYQFPQHPFPVIEASLISPIKNMTSPLWSTNRSLGRQGRREVRVEKLIGDSFIHSFIQGHQCSIYDCQGKSGLKGARKRWGKVNEKWSEKSK